MIKYLYVGLIFFYGLSFKMGFIVFLSKITKTNILLTWKTIVTITVLFMITLYFWEDQYFLETLSVIYLAMLAGWLMVYLFIIRGAVE